MNKLSRIKIAIQWLIGQNLADNQENIGRLLGYTSKSAFSQILNDKKPLPESFIERLCSLNSRLNEVWLLTGEGDMLKSAANVVTGNNNAVQSNSGTVGGHQVNVSGSDYQKIIDKDKIELIKRDANNICLQEVASLKAEISRLEALIKSKDETISAKDVTIEILRNK